MSNAPWLDEAKKYLGQREIAGMADNPVIMKFFVDAGHPEIDHDETPWCAAFVGAMLKRSGYKSTNALNARSYEHFGRELAEPQEGCVVVFPRGDSAWQGHVTFVEKVLPGGRLQCLGGNQSDSVSRAIYLDDHAITYRWPITRLSQPVPVPAPKPVTPLPQPAPTPKQYPLLSAILSVIARVLFRRKK